MVCRGIDDSVGGGAVEVDGGGEGRIVCVDL